MKSVICAVALALLAPIAGSGAARAQEPQPDRFQWLEDIDAPKAMAWVEKQNARTADRLEKDPRYEAFHREALALLTAQDRIPTPHFRAGGIDNFWQDATHVHGIWRHVGEAGYRAHDPQWDTMLDLDALSKAEGKNWIWKGASCLKPEQTLCLVRLSDGGSDAVEVREYDTVRKAFVDRGFRFATGKQTVEWIDHDTLAVAREWSPGEVTKSGYPYVVKVVTRTGPPKEVFRSVASDVSAQPTVLYGEGGHADGLLIRRGVTFFENEFSVVTARGMARVPLPLKAEQEAYVDGQLVFQLKQPWSGYAAGAVIAYDLDQLAADPAHARAQLVFQPGPRQAVQDIAATRDMLLIDLLDEVKGVVAAFQPQGGTWASARLPLPKDANLVLVDADDRTDRVYVTAEGFLDPTSLWLADAASGEVTKAKALPARFDAGQDVVEQFWATSSDGTKIPYFLVRPKAMKGDGSTPTIMYGYGGFELAKPPVYLPEMGKLWLERGGAYVIANIRGGGEFGPAWHDAVLREKRQLAFDDFAAVARDLAARKIADARHLGIYGRSNGGVLTSVSITQHPELWNAAVIESPLIDMLRYSHLSAGASWVGEYGDPDVPADRAFIAKYSAYQALKPGVKYPEPYITTNTRDDRVHPGHARKFAAAMEALGVPYLYYEQTFGGHANDADPELNARRWARHYVYLSQKLMD
jgi:prolyl oligopeptidase